MTLTPQQRDERRSLSGESGAGSRAAPSDGFVFRPKDARGERQAKRIQSRAKRVAQAFPWESAPRATCRASAMKASSASLGWAWVHIRL